MKLKDKRLEANEATWRNARNIYYGSEVEMDLVVSNLNVSKEFIEDRLGFLAGDGYPLVNSGFDLKFIKKTLAEIWLEKRNIGK